MRLLCSQPTDEIRPRSEQHSHLPMPCRTELEASIHH